MTHRRVFLFEVSQMLVTSILYSVVFTLLGLIAKDDLHNAFNK